MEKVENPKVEANGWLGAKLRCPWQLPFIFKGPLCVWLIAQINSSPGLRGLGCRGSVYTPERGAGNWLAETTSLASSHPAF